MHTRHEISPKTARECPPRSFQREERGSYGESGEQGETPTQGGEEDGGDEDRNETHLHHHRVRCCKRGSKEECTPDAEDREGVAHSGCGEGEEEEDPHERCSVGEGEEGDGGGGGNSGGGVEVTEKEEVAE